MSKFHRLALTKVKKVGHELVKNWLVW